MIIKNKIITIVWRPGEWKTFFAVFLASFYERIISNVEIMKNNKKLNFSIRNLWDVENIKFLEKKGVVLLDEWWINVNARESMSWSNKEFWQLAMLWRKKNVDIIIIWQLKRMIDVYYRELSNFIFEMESFIVWKDDIQFTCKIYNDSWFLRKVIKLDLLEFSKITWISYNTLETSRIDKKNLTI